MESSKVISTDKATVIIQVNPQVAQDAVISDDGQEARGAYHNTALTEFFRAQTKALGTAQIMTGMMIFLFGIIRTNDYSTHPTPYPSISAFTGITYWGSLIYISAGSLSVAAQNKLHPCVVKASLIMNVISAITAAAATVLMSIEMKLLSEHYECYEDNSMCLKWKRQDLGIAGILLVFSILQFIISICISGFACKATSNTDSTVVNVALNQVKTLPRMESSEVISTDKATVIIQVNPQVAQDAVISDDGQEGRGAYHNTALTEFFRAQPKALGTVQILTGIMIFLFGIVRTRDYDYGYPISVITGITYWGSLFYISTGSLSVAAQNKLHPCVVKASLIMNVISAITAAAATVLMSIEMKLLSERYECYSYRSMCLKWKRHDLGIVGILLVFSILQFIISICISGFACKATSNTDSTVVNVALNQGN